MLITRLTTIAFALLMIAGCSKDKNEENEPKGFIEGEWNLEEVNFLSSNLLLDPEIDATKGKVPYYAPFILGEVYGYDFIKTKAKGVDGFRAIVIQNYFNAYDKEEDYWYWNYKDNNQSFELIQINPVYPPAFDFSLRNVRNVQLSGDVLTFVMTVESKVAEGNELSGDVQEIDVAVTLKRGKAVHGVKVYVDGEPYSTREKLLDTHWKLEPGSDLYSPGMTGDHDPDMEYMKLAALHLEGNDILNFRYAFPMGITSKKQFAQKKLNESILTTEHDIRGYGIVEINWKVLYVDLDKKIMQLREDESKDVRTFVMVDDILKDVNASDYNIIK